MSKYVSQLKVMIFIWEVTDLKFRWNIIYEYLKLIEFNLIFTEKRICRSIVTVKMDLC